MTLSILQVVILNRDSTVGEEYTSLTKEIEKVEKENSRLAQQIASASALTTISAKSKEYGFGSTPKIVSLHSPLPIAFRNQLSP